MAKITYIEHNGTPHTVEVENGLSVMKGAVLNSIPGILADCGGACACGTCRVFIAENWREIVGGPSDMESAMLEIADESTPGRRLSCQIPVTDELDGLILSMPEKQF